jgi:hypothetical protein
MAVGTTITKRVDARPANGVVGRPLDVVFDDLQTSTTEVNYSKDKPTLADEGAQ